MVLDQVGVELPTRPEALRTLLWVLLKSQPGQNKRQLLAGLRDFGLQNLTKRDINRTLYANSAIFVHDGATPPHWCLAPAALTRVPIPSAVPWAQPRSYVGPDPRAWQTEALVAWRDHDRRGVVEAVTGTGKTMVGVLAAASAVDAGEKVLVLVPGRELLDQWYDELRQRIPGATVGRLGGGHRDALTEQSIVVAIVNSAALWHRLPQGMDGLLVADEVHHYGTPFRAQALDPGFRSRLGLTATYEREDNGIAEYLAPYFGGLVAACSFERGLSDDILAPFRVAFVGVDFTEAEREEYGQQDQRVRFFRHRLISEHGAPGEPHGLFMAHVNRLCRGSSKDSRATWDARRYLNAFSRRRELVANCRSKLDALAMLAPILADSESGLVFGETKHRARQAAEVLQKEGLAAWDFTSDLSRLERRQRMAAFKNGQVSVLSGPRVLDEGIDIPKADVGVVMAASRSKRQMIQRMGRVIRKKEDGRSAIFVVVYVRGTAEDPDSGAHEDFREELIEVAEDVQYFDYLNSGNDLVAWYRRGRL